MSPDLNNSSTDKPIVSTPHSPHDTPSNAEERVHQMAIDIVALLSPGIESNLPITRLDINPANSPELQNIKDNTSLLPDDTFRAFNDLLRLAETHERTLAQIRIKANNNEPITHDILTAHEESFTMGGHSIIEMHHKKISKHVVTTNKSWDKIILKICEVFGQSENTQHWQGLLDAVTDDIMPPLSGINPVLAPVEWAGALVVDIAACEISRKLDQKLKEIGILDQALREDMVVAIKTLTTLKAYLLNNETATSHWFNACRLIYPKNPITGSGTKSIITLQQINIASARLSQLISPIKEYVVLRHEYYARGITVIREADSFCDAAPKIIQDIKRIFMAKEIIRSAHRAKFEQTVYRLGLVIFGYLGSMRDTFNQTPFDPEKQKEFLEDTSFEFVKGAEQLIRDICTILDTHTSRRKSRKAEKIRKSGDRCFNNMGWKTRTLVKPSEVQIVLLQVGKIIKEIWRLAIASGTGKIVESISREDEIERAHVTFDASHESWRRLRRVLGEDVEASLEQLEELLIKEEPMSYMGQIGKFLRIKHQKR